METIRFFFSCNPSYMWLLTPVSLQVAVSGRTYNSLAHNSCYLPLLLAILGLDVEGACERLWMHRISIRFSDPTRFVGLGLVFGWIGQLDYAPPN